MSRPIRPTPTLHGEDAERLLESIERTATPAEIEKRRADARKFMTEIQRPKGKPKPQPGSPDS